MAFFDELGRKISQTGQTAVQKTRDFSDVSRLKSLINQEQARTNDYLKFIGEEYFNDHVNDDVIDEKYRGYFKNLKESQEKIADYTEQIKVIKGVEKCPSCGFDIPLGAPFCSNCGARINRSVDGITCPNCGANVSEDSMFCTSCGAKMNNIAQNENVSEVNNCEDVKVNQENEE